MKKIAVIIGASGGISQAIIKQLLSDQSIDTIVAISRSENPFSSFVKSGNVKTDNAKTDNIKVDSLAKIKWLQSDNSEPSIKECINALKREDGAIQYVVITNGILQTDTIRPERALKSLTIDNLHDVFHVNTVTPSIWLANLTPLLSSQRLPEKEHCVVSVFSARVGSITDNKLGGWHSYRASKAALNMVLKGASIEFERNKKDVRLIAFHPGTTDTELSKPFQASVPEGKLFSPKFVAQQLISIMSETAISQSASPIQFLDWDNQTIDW